MSYCKGDYNRGIIKTQRLPEHLPLLIFFPDIRKLVSKPPLYEFC